MPRAAMPLLPPGGRRRNKPQFPFQWQQIAEVAIAAGSAFRPPISHSWVYISSAACICGVLAPWRNVGSRSNKKKALAESQA